MKVSGLAFVTLLTFAPAVISTAGAADQCTGIGCDRPRAATAFDVGWQYAIGGKFGGITSGETGTALDVARDSLHSLDALDRVATIWPEPPILAKGD
jgi:hypothetical protein